MNILATQYTLATKSLEIYIAGCNAQPKCQGCHNNESWDFNQGTSYIPFFHKNIKPKLKEFESMINNIMIFGGEPLDQPLDEIGGLLMALQGDKPIWLFTRYELKDVPEYIKISCDYIKCGRYLSELSTDDNIQYGVKLATSNQHIYKKGIDY